MRSIIVGTIVLGAILLYVFFSIRAVLRFMHKEDERGEEMNRRFRASQAPKAPEDVEVSLGDQEERVDEDN